MEGANRRIFPLGKATLMLGRGEESDIQLPSDSISQDHASIVLDGEQFVLRDNGSTNGSFVNGERVNHQPLNHMDLVRFGEYLFLVNLTDALPSTAEMAPVREVNLDPPRPQAGGGDKPRQSSHRIALRLTTPVNTKGEPQTHGGMMLDSLSG